MADGVLIEIVSPEKLVFSETADAVSVPGTEGYFTVMGEHAALLTTLKPGFVTVTGRSGEARSFYVAGGFADVSADGVTILADSARTAADYDPAEIEASIKSAQEALDAAEGMDKKNAAQAMLDGWKNLMLEAAHTEGAVRH